MYDDIINVIKKYECKGSFTYASISEEAEVKAENMLGIELPEQYVWFLKNYGHGGINGIETIGVGKDEKLLFVCETIKYRAYGLPKEFIVIENCDEWVYCIDSISGNVVMWSIGNKDCDIAYTSFAEYLKNRLADVIENMED